MACTLHQPDTSLSQHGFTFEEGEWAAMQEGDILLQAGKGLVSDTILLSLNEKIGLTHSAVLVHKQGKWYVIQAINELLTGKRGVHLLELELQLESTRPDSPILVRPHLTEPQRQAFLAFLEEQVQKEILFDNFLSWEDSSAFYCSELIMKALINSGLPGLEKDLEFNGSILTFSNFFNPNYFTVVFSRHKSLHRPLKPSAE